MFSFGKFTQQTETPKKEELEKYLKNDQIELFSQIKKVSFNPKTFDNYSNLLKNYPMQNFPSSHILILREQTRTLNDKNVLTFIDNIIQYHEFMISLSPQTEEQKELRMLIETMFIEVVQKVEKFAQKQIELLQLLVPMIVQLLNSVPDGLLSPYHAVLVHIQFALKDYEEGRKIYKRKYHGLTNGMNAQTLQMYLYYAGCLALFNRDLEESYFLFDQCISMPTKEVTPQLLASWKKIMLLSLIVNYLPYKIKGNPHLESFVNNYRGAEIYMRINDAFINSPDKIGYFINVEGEQLKKEGNFGLAQQVQVSYMYYGIKKVSKAFNSIKIKDLAKRIKLDSAEFERNLKKLVKGGFVNGHIENDVYVFGENVVAKDKMVELFAELQEAEVIFTDMRNHLTQREEERDAILVAEAEEKERKKAAEKK